MIFICLFFLLFTVCSSVNASPNLFGFKTKHGAYLSASSAIAHNGVTIRDNFPWIRKVGSALVCILGDVSDCEELFGILNAQNCAHELDFSGRKISCKSAAHFCQSIISQRLRTNRRLNVEVMIAGSSNTEDSEATPQILWLDSIGSLQNVEYAAHGPDTPFLLSILDQNKSKMQADQVSFSPLDSESGISSALGNVLQARSDDCARFISDQCWAQLARRSRGRIDQSSITLQCVDRTGTCREVVSSIGA